jgi:hypothetical protein
MRGKTLIPLVLVWVGLDDVLPARLVVHAGVAVSAGLAVSLVAFGR